LSAAGGNAEIVKKLLDIIMGQPAAILQSSLRANAIGTNQFDFFNVFFFSLGSSSLQHWSNIPRSRQ
jgi:hypothetical protein